MPLFGKHRSRLKLGEVRSGQVASSKLARAIVIHSGTQSGMVFWRSTSNAVQVRVFFSSRSAVLRSRLVSRFRRQSKFQADARERWDSQSSKSDLGASADSPSNRRQYLSSAPRPNSESVVATILPGRPLQHHSPPLLHRVGRARTVEFSRGSTSFSPPAGCEVVLSSCSARRGGASRREVLIRAELSTSPGPVSGWRFLS